MYYYMSTGLLRLSYYLRKFCNHWQTKARTSHFDVYVAFFSLEYHAC